jgi:NAD(P)-dependent dehydrogenase (short-subunit alcohol dehydrogenase family)
MTMPPRPKTVIVTGAASGIGRACAAALLAAGHRVCGVDVAEVAMDAVPADLRSDFIAVRADIAEATACRAAVAETVEKLGEVTSLIHMAAAHSTLPWRELDADHFNRIMAINVTGAFLMAQAAAERMKPHDGAAIVLTSSGSINVGGVGGHGRGGPAYVSSKAAIIGLTRALARSFASLGIRVNAVSPGSTNTAMTAHYDEEARRKVAERTLVGRIGAPEEIAAVAQFLISDAASYVTGEIVHVNGGGSFG